MISERPILSLCATLAIALFVAIAPDAANAAPKNIESPSPDAPLDEAIGSRSPYLLKGAYSLDVAFPSGGSTTGTSAAGARYLLTDSFAVAAALQLSYDEARRFSAFGITARAIDFLKAKSRTSLFTFAQISTGQTRVKSAMIDSGSSSIAANETTKGQLSLAAGAGLEIFLLPELSTSAEVAIGTNILPSDSMTFTTGTAAIALHYFLLPE